MKRLSLQVIILATLFVGCCVVVLALAGMIFKARNFMFDEHVFTLIAPYYSEANTRFMNFVTFFGSQKFLLPANLLLISIFLLYKKYRGYSLKIVAVSITSTAVMFLLKFILQRERPLVPLITKVHGYSFPSGHSFTSLVFFGMLAYIVFRSVENKGLKWLTIVCCFCFVLLIGFSRVYLRLHYASDVIAGFCLGIIWLLLAKWLLIKTDKV